MLQIKCLIRNSLKLGHSYCLRIIKYSNFFNLWKWDKALKKCKSIRNTILNQRSYLFLIEIGEKTADLYFIE